MKIIRQTKRSSPRVRKKRLWMLLWGVAVCAAVCSVYGRAAAPPAEAEPGMFRVLDTATGEILRLSQKEFICGAVAAEMTLFMHEEALKAQAVAACTFYTRKQQENAGGAYDFTCDTQAWQVYVPKEAMQARWGDRYPAYRAKLEAVAEETAGWLVMWEGSPACTAYFALSAGQTEACRDVWGGDLPYLVPVASPEDVFAADQRTEVCVSPQELAQALGMPAEDPPQEAEVLSRTAGGSAANVRVGDREFTGAAIRRALQLRSAHFDVSRTEDGFCFTVQGWGHGVGMSQAGAHAMAARGHTWQEILLWYYPGTQLEYRP